MMAENCPREVQEQGEVEGGGDGGAAASGDLLVSLGQFEWWFCLKTPHNTALAR